MTKETIVQLNTGLIYDIMNKHFYGVDREDLFQQGALGVINAYNNYKKNGTTKFSTYAFPYIFGEMYKLAMQKQIKVSKDILTFYNKIENTRFMLAQKENRIVTNEEIAIYLNTSLREVNQAIQAGTIMISSLDKANEGERSIYETIPMEEAVSMDDKIALQEGIKQLDDVEKKIIIYRYFQEMTQSEVARKLKKTQVMISRYEKRSLQKIKEFM